MKKTISALLALMLLASCCSAVAETFPLRNQVHFGDKAEDVKARETWTAITGSHAFSFSGTLIGLPSMMAYVFSESTGSLTETLYCVNTVYTEDGKTRYSSESIYPLLLENLTLKYGAPNNTASSDPAAGGSYLTLYLSYIAYAARTGSADFTSISPTPQACDWYFEDDLGTVILSLREYNIVQDGEPRYLTLLDYYLVSSEPQEAPVSYLNDL